MFKQLRFKRLTSNMWNKLRNEQLTSNIWNMFNNVRNRTRHQTCETRSETKQHNVQYVKQIRMQTLTSNICEQFQTKGWHPSCEHHIGKQLLTSNRWKIFQNIMLTSNTWNTFQTNITSNIWTLVETKFVHPVCEQNPKLLQTVSITCQTNTKRVSTPNFKHV